MYVQPEVKRRREENLREGGDVANPQLPPAWGRVIKVGGRREKLGCFSSGNALDLFELSDIRTLSIAEIMAAVMYPSGEGRLPVLRA